MAFCASGKRDREEAREQVMGVLEREKGYESYDLAYLGLLDYREMEAPVESMLELFEKFDPVWLVFFRRVPELRPSDEANDEAQR